MKVNGGRGGGGGGSRRWALCGIRLSFANVLGIVLFVYFVGQVGGL